MVVQLKEQHDRLRGIADRLDMYLSEATAPANPEFPQLRWMLVRELSVHIATERQMLAAWQTRTGRVLRQFDRGLEDAFADHIATWGGVAILPMWSRYRVATRALLARLRARMDFEEGSVLPVMDGTTPRRP